MDTVKVKFKQAAYLPDPNNPANTILYRSPDNLPEGDDGVYEFPSGYPLPTRDIEIVSGTSTYVKPADAAPEPTTEIKPSVRTEGDKKSRAKK
jgi:hypothetical protein